MSGYNIGMKRIKNQKTGKEHNFFVKDTNKISTKVKQIVKANPYNISLRQLPSGYAVDYKNRTIIKTTKSDGNARKFISDMDRDRLNSIGFSSNDKRILNFDSGNFIDKSVVFNKEGRGSMKKEWSSNYEVRNSKLQLKGAKYRKTLDSTLDGKNLTLTSYQTTRPPNNLTDYLNAIRTKFNYKYSSVGDTDRVILKFGNQFRTFKKKQIMEFTNEKFEEAVENYADNATGSDNSVSLPKEMRISMANLDKSFFQLRTTPRMRVGHQRVKCRARYWKTNQPPTKDNHCLEGAVRTFLGLSTRTKQMRCDIMKVCDLIYPESKIDIALFDIYEDFYKINIKVYTDTPHTNGLVDEANLIRDTEKNYEKTLKLLFHDEHIYYITGKHLQIKECAKLQTKLKKLEKSKLQNEKNKAKQDIKRYLVAFDIETIFDKNDLNFLKCYSISWFVWEEDKPFHYLEDLHTKEPYCFYARGEGCMDKFLSFLLKQPKDVIYKPIGFNNSRFDNFVLCDYALNQNLVRDLFYVNGSILKCEIGGGSGVWDISRFLTGSLDKCCKSFGTNPKKQPDLISHYEIQVYFEKYGWKGLNELLDNNAKLVLYNKFDVICLIDLTQKLRKTFKTLWKEDIMEYMTIASMSYAKLRSIWKDKEMEILPANNYKEDLFFRGSLTAGRTQSFYGKFDFKMPVAMVDVKSLYPTTMGSYGENDCPYPYGDYRYVEKEEEDKLGIYNVDIIHQRCKWKKPKEVYKAMKLIKEKYGYDIYKEYAPNVIAKREKDKPLDWDFKHDIPNIQLTSVDIEVIRWATEDHNSVIVRDGYVWDDQRYDLFIDYLDPLKKEKTRQDTLKGTPEYNEPLREGTKLGSNSISGKLLEKIHEDVSSIMTTKNFIKMERDKNISEIDILELGGSFSLLTGKKSKEFVFEDARNNKPSYLGMFVYSYSRKLMYQKILGRYVSLYMDTDSSCLPLCEYDRMCNENLYTELIDTGEYGCLEEEVCHFKKCDECKNLHWKEYNKKPMKEGKRCKKCIFEPADRIIAIAPKNYLVENSKYQYLSKRKFKGVRKNDLWRPLKDWGEVYYNEDGTLSSKCEAKKAIRNLSQDEIRDMRENKCCEKCIRIDDEYEFNYQKCLDCVNKSKFMLKAYSTEMFEELVKGEKVCVFASNINKIKFSYEDEISWEFMDELEEIPNLRTLTNIFNSYNREGKKQPMEMKFKASQKEIDRFFKKLDELMVECKKSVYKGNKNKWAKVNLVQEFNNTYRKFVVEANTRSIKNILQLKQQYMIKII